ncbi:MAG: integrin alpha, partial [Planctomycetaceae bacterium]
MSGAGDVNGDGFDDLIIGTPHAGPGGNGAGETYVVFGKSSSFTATVDLSTLNGTNGFRLDGIDAEDRSGYSVSSAGDVNGDGFDDMIIGAQGYFDPFPPNPGEDKAVGESYVVFGKSSGFTATIDLSALNGTNGFRLGGIDARDRPGYSVSSAGDVNGDGFDDMIIGAPGSRDHFPDPGGEDASKAGETYVVFGKSSGFTAAVDLSTLDGTDGFRLDGIDEYDYSGSSVSAAGDVNGDGFDDLIIGARLASRGGDSHAGESYVVFGKSSGFTAAVDLSTLAGTDGFRLDGLDSHDLSGWSVSSAGDVNGDGFDDMIISASHADLGTAVINAGESYVVFGKSSGFTATVDLSTLNGTNGFRLDGIDANDRSGYSVSSAGDVNGDGFDDLIIGAHRADPGGDSLAGETYVVFGGNFTGGMETQVGDATANTLTANQGVGAIDILIGGQGSDTLISDGGQDVLYGGEGADTLAIVSTAFQRVAGGNGTDTLRLDGSGLTLDLTTLADNTLTDIEVIDITGSGANTLTLDFQEVVNLSSTSNTLTVRANGDDIVNIGTGWTQGSGQSVNGVLYNKFTQGAATLLVQDVVNDDPTLDAIGNLTINEDASEQTVNLSGITVGGGESQPLRVTTTSSNTGLIPNPTVTYTSANVTGSIAFTPVTDQNGTATITVTVEDGGLDGNLDTAGDNTTFSRTFDVIVAAVNDAPVLAMNPSVPCTSLPVNASDPVSGSTDGALSVDSLVGQATSPYRFFDKDGDAAAIAITAFDDLSGRLWFSVDNGITWRGLTSASRRDATLLFANSTTWLHYTRTVHDSSHDSTLFRFIAWDRTGPHGNGATGIDT